MTSEVITGSMESLFLLDALVDHLVPRQTFLHFVYFHQFQESKQHFHNGNNNLAQTRLSPIFHQTYIYDLHEQPEFQNIFMVSLKLIFT